MDAGVGLAVDVEVGAAVGLWVFFAQRRLFLRLTMFSFLVRLAAAFLHSEVVQGVQTPSLQPILAQQSLLYSQASYFWHRGVRGKGSGSVVPFRVRGRLVSQMWILVAALAAR